MLRKSLETPPASIAAAFGRFPTDGFWATENEKRTFVHNPAEVTKTHNRTLSRPLRFLQSSRSFTETQPGRIRGTAGDL